MDASTLAAGLIYYLPPAAVTALFGAIAELSAPGSRVYFDYLHQEDLMGTQVPPTPAYTVTARRWVRAERAGGENWAGLGGGVRVA